MNNIFPESCGYEVAKAWCPITSFSFLGLLLILAIIIITIYFGYIIFIKKVKEVKL